MRKNIKMCKYYKEMLDYSDLSEQVCGVWFDGSTLYRRNYRKTCVIAKLSPQTGDVGILLHGSEIPGDIKSTTCLVANYTDQHIFNIETSLVTNQPDVSIGDTFHSTLTCLYIRTVDLSPLSEVCFVIYYTKP